MMDSNVDSKSAGKFALAILAVAIIIGIVFIFFSKRVPVAAPNSPAAVPPQPVLTSAPKGETITGFPREFILDKAAEVGSSYSLSYNANLNQYTASYTSKITMGGLFNMYKSYYQKNGWTITNEITKYPASRGLYAVSASTSEEASVAIIDTGKACEVIVNYLKK